MIRLLLFLVFSIFGISIFGQEVCDNEKDDDGDGLIDLFDPDCDCLENTYQAICEIECDYVPDHSFSIRRKWASDKVSDEYMFFTPPVVGDLDGDGKSEIICLKEKRLSSTSDSYKIYVAIYDSETGEEIRRWFHTDQIKYSAIGGACLADADRDGTPEIYVITRDSDFVCYDPNGVVIWRKALPDNEYLMPNIADFNCDGIPEIYVGNTILNAQTGHILFRDMGSPSSCNYECHISHSIAADLRPAPGLELAAGNIVYEVQINNLMGETGNQLIPYTISTVTAGVTSVGDIDGDGLLDVVVNRQNTAGNGGLWVYNPRTLQLMASASGGVGGGIPFVGDVDGDCQADIGVVYTEALEVYTYDGSEDLSLLWRQSSTDQSGYTSMTMFDFDQDGKNEVVYRDESTLRVFKGKNGAVIASLPVYSTTWHEYPVIADVDNDNEAELIVSGNVNKGFGNQVLLFESDDMPWAPARAVLNQVGYHVTNVKDDLTIPKVPQNQAVFLDTEDCFLPTCSQPYNTFLAQATYRNQMGCIQFPTVDLTPDITSITCTSEGVELCFTIENSSADSDFDGLLTVSLYSGDPTIEGNVLHQDEIALQIGSEMGTDEICHIIPFSFDVEEVFIVINANSTVITPSSFPANGNVECDYSNNMDSQTEIESTQNLDLGEDRVLCGMEEALLDAGSSFASYLWSTGAITQSIEVDESGTYSVEAIDFCNNIYSDTVEIIKNEVVLIDVETMRICEMNSTSLSIDPALNATNIEWSPLGILDCTDCEMVTIQPIEPTFVYVSAMVDGCVYHDSVFIDLVSETMDMVYLSGCTGDSIQVDNIWYYSSTSFSTSYSTTTGCDSIIQFELMFSEPFYTLEEVTFCDGDSVFIDGQWFDESMQYLAQFTTMNGCDSVITYDILEVPSEISIDTTICGSDSIWIGDHYVSIAGLYLDTLVVGECISISAIHLEVVEIEMVDILSTVCPGDTIYLDGNAISESGVYEVTQYNDIGCDTIHIYEIIVLDSTSPPTMDIDCEKEAHIVSIQIPLGWDAVWDNGATDSTTYYENATLASVVLTYNSSCPTKYELDLPSLPETAFLPTLDDILVLEGEEVEIDLVLPLGWEVLWQSEAAIDCNVCESVQILADTSTVVEVLFVHESGCTYEASFLITLVPSVEIFIPNTFSPNGDQHNDAWVVDLGVLNAIQIQIYDRWGNLMFVDDNAHRFEWDGSVDGARVASGVYVYRLIYVDISGKERVRYGDITVLY